MHSALQPNVDSSIASQYLPITRIRTDGGTQSRAQLDREAIADYAEAMIEGATFPPVIVFYDGQDYWLADGFHRIHAASQAQLTQLTVEVRFGSRREAVLYSVGANANHGLRRTIADKRRAVLVLLSDPEWISWSNREIAKQCGVTEKLVRNLKEELNQLSASQTQIDPEYLKKCGVTEMTIREAQQRLLIQSQERTALRNGKAYILDTTKIGNSRNSHQQPCSANNTSAAPALSGSEISEDFGEIVMNPAGNGTNNLPYFDNLSSLAPTKTGQLESEPESYTTTKASLSPQDLVIQPKSKDKQLLPDLPPNADIPPSQASPTPAALINSAAIASGKPDIVAVEISIGLKSLTPNQLAWALNNAASYGLSDAHLKAAIKAAKQALNTRHHFQYFQHGSKTT